MLRHSENTPVQSRSVPETPGKSYPAEQLIHPEASRQPFTAEEIAKAITEIEREKTLHLSEQSSEAQIASVLEHLNLDMTPSEVATKIERQRLARVHSMKTQRRRRSVFVALVAGLSCIGIGGLFLGMNAATVHEPALITAPMQAAPVVYAERVPDQDVKAAEAAPPSEQRAVDVTATASQR